MSPTRGVARVGACGTLNLHSPETANSVETGVADLNWQCDPASARVAQSTASSSSSCETLSPSARPSTSPGGVSRRACNMSRKRPSSARPVLYKSSALANTAPSLAFRRYNSKLVAKAAAEADAVRDKFKREQLEAAGVAEEEGDDEEVAVAKKYKRRLLLNRHSAAASRLRKEAYVSSLESILAKVEAMYGDFEKNKEEIRGTITSSTTNSEGKTGKIETVKEEPLGVADSIAKESDELFPTDDAFTHSGMDNNVPFLFEGLGPQSAEEILGPTGDSFWLWDLDKVSYLQ